MTASSGAFYVTGGTLRPDARCYVERQADHDLVQALLAGEFCYALTSRQVGKSSLMIRAVHRLREQGVRVAVMDLTSIGQNLSVEQWYDGLLMKLGRQLDLTGELEEFWGANSRLGPLHRWNAALESVVLKKCPGKIVLFVDELDVVRSLPFSTDEFFATIREWYNRRSQEPEIERLTFCLLGVAAPTDLIRDTRLTPFNIGRRIELTDFTESEAQPLATALHRDPEVARVLLKRILHWTGGHPYLTQRLCRAAAEAGNIAGRGDVDRLCRDLFLSPKARDRDDNLVFVRERLVHAEVDRPALLQLYNRVRKGKSVADDETSPTISILRLAGIVRVEKGFLRVRNRIYAGAFDHAWVLSNLPNAELRRQRVAFRKGLLWAGGIAVFALAALLASAIYQAPYVDEAPLPDGSILRLKSWDFGKLHYFEPGRVRLHWLREVLPGGLANMLPKQDDHTTIEDTLGLWLELENKPDGGAPANNFWANWRWYISDEHNSELYLGELSPNYSVNRPPGEHSPAATVKLWTIPIFPRRGETLKISIYNGTAQGPDKLWPRIAEFSVPNRTPTPYRGADPDWYHDVQATPITNLQDGFSFELHQLSSAARQTQLVLSNRLAIADRAPWTEARVGISRDGTIESGWQARLIVAEDATGNKVQPGTNRVGNLLQAESPRGTVRLAPSGSFEQKPLSEGMTIRPGDRILLGPRTGVTLHRGEFEKFSFDGPQGQRGQGASIIHVLDGGQFYDEGQGVLRFPGGLPESEIWKMRIGFSRGQDESDQWQLRDLSVPLAKSIGLSTISTNVADSEIEFLGIAGPSAVFPIAEHLVNSNSTLFFRFTPATKETKLDLVRVRDGGQDLSFVRAANTNATPRGVLAWEVLAANPGVSLLDLTVRVEAAYEVEFVTAPSLSGNSARPGPPGGRGPNGRGRGGQPDNPFGPRGRGFPTLPGDGPGPPPRGVGAP